MTKTEIIALVILLGCWAMGSFVYYLYLLNNNGDTKFKNVKSAFFLALAFGVAAAFIGAKANISFWLVWVVYAVGGAVVTNQMLKKKDKPIPGVYGKGITAEDKEDVAAGLRNVGLIIVLFTAMALIGSSKYPGWLIAFGPVSMGAAGYLYSKKNWKATAAWAALGLLAGLGFYYLGTLMG